MTTYSRLFVVLMLSGIAAVVAGCDNGVSAGRYQVQVEGVDSRTGWVSSRGVGELTVYEVTIANTRVFIGGDHFWVVRPEGVRRAEPDGNEYFGSLGGARKIVVTPTQVLVEGVPRANSANVTVDEIMEPLRKKLQLAKNSQLPQDVREMWEWLCEQTKDQPNPYYKIEEDPTDLVFEWDFRGTPVTGKQLKALSKLEWARLIYLSGTKITDDDAMALGDFDNLTLLHLSDTAITDATILNLGEKPKLTILHLENTGITDAALPAMMKMPKLLDLYLQGTDVTNEGILKLAAHPYLGHVYVRDTKVTKDAIEEMRKKNPEVVLNFAK